jgi:ABC-type glycerol-3-phosphate transport system permease component
MTREKLTISLNYLFLVLVSLLMLVPFFWLLSMSFKLRGEMFSWPPTLIPRQFTLVNYLNAAGSLSFLRSYRNSLIISLSDVVLGLVVCSLAGFAFAKYEFRFKSVLFSVVLVSMMIPFHIVVIPLYLEMKKFGLYDTYWGVILPFLPKAFGVFFMKQYLQKMPDEVLDAARIDGANDYFIWLNVVVPLSKPAFGVLACLFFVENWNMLIWPMIVLQSQRKQTLQIFLQSLIGVYRVDYGVLLAGSTLAILPIFILFLAMQKQIVHGLTAGAVRE